MYTLYKFHFFNGISEINQLFDDILIIWPAPVYSLFLCIACAYLSVCRSVCLSVYVFYLIYFSDTNQNFPQPLN